MRAAWRLSRPLSFTVSRHMHRSALRIALAFVAVVGVVLLAIPFVLSLGPSERASATGRMIDIGDLAPGRFLTVDGWDKRFFILKDLTGDVRVLYVPYDAKKGVMMPDLKWWRYGGRCRDFEPDNDSGKLIVGGHFRCHDSDVNEWWAPRWVWDFSGHHAGATDEGIEDMPQLKPRLIGTNLILSAHP